MPHPAAPTRLLAVVVVFERSLSDVRAWPLLRDALAASDGAALQLTRVLIYDNSAQPRAHIEPLPAGCEFVHDPHNGGTAAAYTRASALAIEAGIDWLLLLDHDTGLPQGYLRAAGAALAGAGPQVRALVPWVLHGATVVSPARLSAAGTVAPLALRAPVAADAQLTAVSSGSLIHAPTLARCLPLPRGLWLDYVDHWIFAQLRRRGFAVAVFDAVIEHDLSIASLDDLSLQRLTGILDGEAVFQAALGWRARTLYPLRLLARTARYARARPALARHTLAWIAARLARGR